MKRWELVGARPFARGLRVDTSHVPPKDRLHLWLSQTSLQESGSQELIAARVFEARWSVIYAVIIRADPDMLNPCDLDRMADVITDSCDGERRSALLQKARACKEGRRLVPFINGVMRLTLTQAHERCSTLSV